MKPLVGCLVENINMKYFYGSKQEKKKKGGLLCCPKLEIPAAPDETTPFDLKIAKPNITHNSAQFTFIKLHANGIRLLQSRSIQFYRQQTSPL